MSQTKFRIDDRDEIFIYDNKINAILNAEGVPMAPESVVEFSNPRFDKSDVPDTIKVILGHACNYSCSYCLQKDIGNPSERPKNIMTKELVKKMKGHLDLSKLNRVELWGGETLLYWPDIVEIMSSLDREGLTWFIPTNGTVLRLKHVEFFKTLKGKVTLGISHDGPGHEKMRGPEFLDRKVEELRALQEAGVEFSFNTVISKDNYDLFEIDKYFRDFIVRNGLKPISIVYGVARTYDTGDHSNESQVITKEQIPHYRAILKAYLKQHLEDFRAKKQWEPSMLLPTGLFHLSNGVIPYAKSLRRQSPIHHYSSCGTDHPHLITLDINGNLRTCQNVNEDYIYGTVSNIRMAKMNKVDYSKDDFCSGCSVLRLCNRSCPISLPFESFFANHLIENAHYGEIQLSAFELLFNSPITKLEQIESAN